MTKETESFGAWLDADTGGWPTAIFCLLVVLGVVASCVGSGGTFGQRCGRVYDGAALERCVSRVSKGGPLYEENIGRMP